MYVLVCNYFIGGGGVVVGGDNAHHPHIYRYGYVYMYTCIIKMSQTTEENLEHQQEQLKAINSHISAHIYIYKKEYRAAWAG